LLLALTEALRCPRDHDESYVVCVPVESEGSDVRRGVVGCPVCHAEYPIADGVVHFGRVGEAAPVEPLSYDAAALEAFLGLEGRGGYVALAGSAARHAAELAERLKDVHVVAVNPPVQLPTAVSAAVCPDALPLRSRSMRAVALGRDAATPPWVAEAVRVVLPGLRVVVESDAAEPEGVEVLMRGGGVLVGQKRAR
jgi:uncharacterized protein YbaR (Trm112 family)